ncbi:MAG: glycosyltransferase [Clostridia bacterium]|nr:glycosyltransferase [Clostridia bacterium]
MIKLNILISAYAVSPTWGSEPGMGWNWIINIAKYCNVHVITESEWRNEILEAVKELPQKDNLHFYFNPVPEKVRLMCWNQGDWRFYWYYRKWQKQTLSIAKDIIKNNDIDIIHQLNMVGFREPGFLWQIKSIPFVWGPICGMDMIPVNYLINAGWKTKIKCIIKNNINKLQFRFYPRVRSAFNNASAVICATETAKQAVEKIYDKQCFFINETGTEVNTKKNIPKRTEGVFNVLWVGRFIYTKRLDIALRSLALTSNASIQLTVCGTGSKEEVDKYHNLAVSLGINSRVKWLGKVNHDKIGQIMMDSDLFFFTSIMEATSTVVLEAISYQLPILAFNTCGFGPLVKKFAGITIELSNENQSIREFAEKLDYLSENRNILNQISENEENNSYMLSWDYKAKTMLSIYKTISNPDVRNT